MVVFRVGTMFMIKRVIGLPGELIELVGGEVMVDGIRLADIWSDQPTLPDLTVVLEEDEVFVLSDNRMATRSDSRVLGGVKVGDVNRVIIRYHRAR